MGHRKGTVRAHATTSEPSTLHDSPAWKITKKPDAKMRSAVPRSGWRVISPTGITRTAAAIRKSRIGTPDRGRWKDQPPEAEYTMAMPSAMVRARAAISGPSMRRDRISKSRLITLLVLVAQGRFHLLVQQVVVEHRPRDRRRGGAAVAAVLDQDRQRELGIVGRREGDEERVVAMLFLDALLVVALALLHADHLRGAGLGGDGVG